MDAHAPDSGSVPRLDTRRPLSIAVMAMGGQGGGVLVDWIVALAEGQGWLTQSTSVPGVAQRTGATIYYVETMKSDGSGRRPVLSLMPVPGEVDIVIGAELMEAGRAMQRGLVSPDRTTLIASSHRAYAVSVFNGAPTNNLDNNTSQVNTSVTDRYMTLAQTGIAPSMSVLFIQPPPCTGPNCTPPPPPPPVCTYAQEVTNMCGKLGDRVRTYWREGDAN